MWRPIGGLRRCVTAFTLALSCLAASNAYAGPIILAGHDADDHGFAGVYADLFDAIQANVTNGNTGILAIGADPPPAEAGTGIEDVDSMMLVPQGVTYANDAAITTVDFSTYAIIFVPSTVVEMHFSR